MPERDPIDVLAVLTLEYSGSTILAMAAGTHPDVVTLSEGQALYWKAIRPTRYEAPEGTNVCSCGAPFEECPFCQAIAAAVRERVPPRIAALEFPRWRFFFRPRIERWARARCLRAAAAGRQDRLPPIVRGRYHAVAAANAVIVDTARELAGARVYLETGKDATATALLATSTLHRARLVHWVRDGRGQVLSAARNHPDLGVEGACRRWLERTTEHLRILRMLGDRHETVRYEDFCADPVAVVHRLWRLCGLEPVGDSIDFSRAPRHVIGNRGVRFAAVEEIRDRKEWRERLSAEDLATFERICGPLHRELGYD